MAERAKRRLTAAKLSVSFAVAAVLAGFVARDKSPASVAYQLTGSQPHAAPETWAPRESPSRGIKPHSLFYKDFVAGQVYSQKAANRLFIKMQDANKVFLQKADAANTYLDKSSAAATYLKFEDAQSRFISGNGKVFTGVGSSQAGLIGLLDIAGLATVQGNHPAAGGPDLVHITNTSGSPLEFDASGNQLGIIAVDQSVDLTINGGAPITVQMLVPAVQKIATLTISLLPATGGGADFVAQALVGAP